MGWTTFHSNEPVREWFKSNYTHDNFIVLDVAIVKRTQLYAAVKNISSGNVICFTFMLCYSNSYYNFGYKDMTEFEHPYLYECPERIFKLLTPLDETDENNEYAIQWRKCVEQEHAKRKQAKTIGDKIICVKEALRYSNGCYYQYFKKIGRSFYAMMKIDNEFKSICKVRFKPSNYEYELI
jgi:hypothetical protein